MFEAFRGWCLGVLRIPGEPELPPGDEKRTQRFRAAPNYYRYLLLLWGLKSAVVLGVILPMEIGHFVATLKLQPSPWINAILWAVPQIIAVLLVAERLFSLLLVRLNFEQRWYLITDRSLRLREGLLEIREITVTFANIQNVSISQGPIQRLLGIADLRVDTAGGGGQRLHHGREKGQNLHTAWFRGVDNANAIREVVQQRLRQLKDAGLGDHEEALANHPAAQSLATPGLLSALREVAVEATALRETVAAG